MESRTYLVTGTAGFIGFHIAKRLLEAGHRVIGIDSMNDYYDVRIKRKRNALLKRCKKYVFIRADISELKSLLSAAKKHRPDMIIHMAAQAGVRYSIINPWAYASSNVIGTLNILECARQLGIKRVIYASTSSIYGTNKQKPFRESHRTSTQTSIYAATKKSNEAMAYAYFHLFGIETIGLRFFTVYGPFGRPDLAIFKFSKNMMQEQPIKVYNRGRMKRDFTYIDDIVDGVMACVTKRRAGYEIYNLGGGDSVGLLRMIRLLEKALGKKAKIRYLPMQPGDVKETSADVSLARKRLGWKPRTGIEEGIRLFSAWFRKNKGWLLKLEDGKQ